MYDLTYHLRSQTMDDFRKKYRTCDLLIVENIEDFFRKEMTQKEFFFVIEDLLAQNKQVVLTSSVHPKQKGYLMKRLFGKIVSGLIIEIKPNDISTKEEIIMKKAEKQKIVLPNDIAVYITKSTGDNINEIEGLLIKIHVLAQILNRKLDMEFVESIIEIKGDDGGTYL